MQILTAQWILPIAAPPIGNGYVIVDDHGRIEALGRLSELGDDVSAPPPEPGSLLSPGLINAHVHLEQSFPAPIPRQPEEPFTHWLQAVVAANRAASGHEARAARCIVGVSELLRTGTTCVNDIASGPESSRALAAAGLRGVVSLEVFHPDFETVSIMPMREAYTRFKANFSPDGPLQPGLSPHSPYNVSPAAWQALLEACQPGLVHTHVAEFEDEIRYLRGEPSAIPALHRAVLGRSFRPPAGFASPVEMLARHHLLSARTVLAHVIHTSGPDRALIAGSGAKIAHCPRSNLALHAQTLHAEDWQGIPMGLGTDGRLSTGDLDLRAEARRAMALHGWPAARALRALTLAGAQVMHLADETGSLAIGKWADCVFWQAEPAVLTAALPADLPDGMARIEENLAALLLSPATAVREVRAAGKVVWSHERQPDPPNDRELQEIHPPARTGHPASSTRQEVTR